MPRGRANLRVADWNIYLCIGFDSLIVLILFSRSTRYVDRTAMRFEYIIQCWFGGTRLLWVEFVKAFLVEFVKAFLAEFVKACLPSELPLPLPPLSPLPFDIKGVGKVWREGLPSALPPPHHRFPLISKALAHPRSPLPPFLWYQRGWEGLKWSCSTKPLSVFW